MDRGEWGDGNGKDSRMNRTGYNIPKLIYEYITSVTLHHVQPQKWEVVATRSNNPADICYRLQQQSRGYLSKVDWK